MIKVILTKDVPRVGTAGSVISVKEGYARNYLLAQKLAICATPGNLASAEKKSAKRLAELEQAKGAALTVKAALEREAYTIAVQAGEQDKLYGSVTVEMIVAACRERGQTIDKQAVQLDEQIRTLGEHAVSVKLHPDVTATLKVLIVKA